jgi:lysozyme
MHISLQGLQLIQRFEGFSPVPYADVAGIMTIGYGHAVRPDESFEGITEQEAAELLKNDVCTAERAVMRFISTALQPYQFDALVSFTFNLGAGALQRSTLRGKINRGEHEEVPGELKKWIWSGGRRWPGLLRRRIAEGMLYEG